MLTPLALAVDAAQEAKRTYEKMLASGNRERDARRHAYAQLIHDLFLIYTDEYADSED